MSFNENNFTMQDFKKLLREAFEFDYDKHKGKVKLAPLTMVEYYESDLFKEQLALYFDDVTRLEELPNKSHGVYCHKLKNVYVFLKSQREPDKTIVNGVITVFHELSHHYDYNHLEMVSNNHSYSFFDFSLAISYFVFENVEEFYKAHWDHFLQEIQAELYGTDRTKEFLKSKGMLTEERKNMLAELKNRYLFRLNDFDVHIFLNEIHKFVTTYDFKINGDDFWYLSLFYKYNKIKRLLLGDFRLKFRPIEEILELANFSKIDKQILDYFFSSKDFLDSLDFNTLSLEHKQIIMNAIEWSLGTEMNRRKKNKEFLQNKQIKAKQYLDADARICSKIAYFNKKLEEIKKTMSLNNINENSEEFKK